MVASAIAVQYRSAAKFALRHNQRFIQQTIGFQIGEQLAQARIEDAAHSGYGWIQVGMMIPTAVGNLNEARAHVRAQKIAGCEAGVAKGAGAVGRAITGVQLENAVHLAVVHQHLRAGFPFGDFVGQRSKRGGCSSGLFGVGKQRLTRGEALRPIRMRGVGKAATGGQKKRGIDHRKESGRGARRSVERHECRKNAILAG